MSNDQSNNQDDISQGLINLLSLVKILQEEVINLRYELNALKKSVSGHDPLDFSGEWNE